VISIKIGSERESVEMCILRGFLKGTYFRSVGRPNSTFAREWLINRGLAVEMTLRGRDDGASATTVLPAIGAWKPAKDAGFHIPTATATAAVKLRQTAKPPPIVHFYRFSLRTEKTISLTRRERASRRISQFATVHVAFTPSVWVRPLGFRVSRSPVRSLSLQPNDSLTIPKG
jgi:hypothetical protein